VSTRALVLGGGGFLGGLVSRWLLQNGYRVRLFDLRAPAWSTSPSARGDAGALEIFEGNFLNGSDLDRALDGVELVLHFVSMTVPATSVDNVSIEIETNLAATVRLLDRMVARGIKCIGYPSSGGTIYRAAAHPHREDEPPGPTCPYGLGKLLIEETLHYYRAHKGIETQIWRIANPYGDAAKLHLAQGAIDAFLLRILQGQPITLWGDGSAVRDFVFGEDVAAAIGALLERGAWGETVNIGAGAGVSIASALEVIRATVDRPVLLQQVAGYTGPLHAVLDSTKLKQLTGWAPRYDLQSGIAEAWQRLLAR
jgi:UDP-glucose 4-epimerase